MSKPVNIQQQRNPAAVGGGESAPSLHSLQDSQGRLLRTVGSLGSFSLGGPLLQAKSVVSVDVGGEDLLLTPDQVIGAEIHINSGSTGNLQVPTAASIVNYLSRKLASPSAITAAGQIVNDGANDTLSITTPSIYVPTFDFSIFVAQGATAPQLQTNGACEVRAKGLGTAAAGANYAGLLAGAAGLGYENRFRGYVLDARRGSEVVAIVPLAGAQA